MARKLPQNNGRFARPGESSKWQSLLKDLVSNSKSVELIDRANRVELSITVVPDKKILEEVSSSLKTLDPLKKDLAEAIRKAESLYSGDTAGKSSPNLYKDLSSRIESLESALLKALDKIESKIPRYESRATERPTVVSRPATEPRVATQRPLPTKPPPPVSTKNPEVLRPDSAPTAKERKAQAPKKSLELSEADSIRVATGQLSAILLGEMTETRSLLKKDLERLLELYKSKDRSKNDSLQSEFRELSKRVSSGKSYTKDSEEARSLDSVRARSERAVTSGKTANPKDSSLKLLSGKDDSKSRKSFNSLLHTTAEKELSQYRKFQDEKSDSTVRLQSQLEFVESSLKDNPELEDVRLDLIAALEALRKDDQKHFQTLSRKLEDADEYDLSEKATRTFEDILSITDREEEVRQKKRDKRQDLLDRTLKYTGGKLLSVADKVGVGFLNLGNASRLVGGTVRLARRGISAYRDRSDLSAAKDGIRQRVQIPVSSPTDSSTPISSRMDTAPVQREYSFHTLDSPMSLFRNKKREPAAVAVSTSSKSAAEPEVSSSSARGEPTALSSVRPTFSAKPTESAPPVTAAKDDSDIEYHRLFAKQVDLLEKLVRKKSDSGSSGESSSGISSLVQSLLTALGLGGLLKGGGGGIGGLLKTVLSKGKSILVGAASSAGALVKTIGSGLASAARTIGSMAAGLGRGLMAALPRVAALLGPVAAVLSAGYVGWQIGTEFYETFATEIQDGIEAVMNTVTKVINFVSDGITWFADFWKDPGKKLKELGAGFSAAWDKSALGKAAGSVGEYVAGKLGIVSEIAAKAKDAAVSSVDTAATAVSSATTAVADSAKATAAYVGDKSSAIATTAASEVSDAAAGVSSAVSSGVSTAVKAAAPVISSVVPAVKSAASSVASGVSSAASAVVSAGASAFGSMREAAGKLFKVAPSVNTEGINPAVQSNFVAMASEYKDRGGKGNITVNSGYRSYEEQAKLYAQDPTRAAPPGRSAHGSGLAIDINRKEAGELDSMGLLSKYGFSRPLLNARTPEPWHLQAKGTATSLASQGVSSSDLPNNQGSSAALTPSGMVSTEMAPTVVSTQSSMNAPEDVVPGGGPTAQTSTAASDGPMSRGIASSPSGNSVSTVPTHSYMDTGFFFMNAGLFAG